MHRNPYVFTLASGYKLRVKASRVFHFEVFKPKKLYCVYVHIYNNEIFYVGHGRGQRPFDLGGRNDGWTQFVQQIGCYTIAIVGQYATKNEAFYAEAALIKAAGPRFNMPRNGGCKTNGKVYLPRSPVKEAENTRVAVATMTLQAQVEELQQRVDAIQKMEPSFLQLPVKQRGREGLLTRAIRKMAKRWGP